LVLAGYWVQIKKVVRNGKAQVVKKGHTSKKCSQGSSKNSKGSRKSTKAKRKLNSKKNTDLPRIPVRNIQNNSARDSYPQFEEQLDFYDPLALQGYSRNGYGGRNNPPTVKPPHRNGPPTINQAVHPRKRMGFTYIHVRPDEYN
jgi:hypothetical protein